MWANLRKAKGRTVPAPFGCPIPTLPRKRGRVGMSRLAEQVVDADLEGINIDFAGRHGAEGVCSAKPVMQILEFGAPIRCQGPFNAGAGAPPRQPGIARKRNTAD